uniref:Uncharacterized protein n=1 Tax=Leersia perrieri TaxID=77586 RepID=A0A0D9X744_9ORYZ
MSVQCAVRALAALPSSRRRGGVASHVATVPSPLRLPIRRAVAPVRAAESSPSSPPPAAAAAAGKALVPDEEFTLAKVWIRGVFQPSSWFRVVCADANIWYAELKPVPCTTYADAFALREKCATPILNQVRSDVTRYRYGDEQHLDEALKRIFQYGLGGGIPRRSAPILQNIREEVTDEGKYSLVLVFEAKALELSDFEKRQAKFTSFFGPGIKAEIGKSGDDLYEVRLISETT